MKIINYTEVEAENLDLPGAKGVKLGVVAGKEDGACGFTAMVLTIEPGGHTPDHSHPWAEEIFIHKGQGEVKAESLCQNILAGDSLFFAAEEPHQFIDTSDKPLVMVCVIPI